MMILFAITHISAMILLMVARLQRADGNDGGWYDAWNEEDATDFEEYVDSMFWAT
jgi:hypothetical protein